MIEKWEVIDDYPNYEISTQGKVRNNRGLIMKQRKTPNGYKEIGLRSGGKGQKFFLVHRLVAKSFITPVKGKVYVNHLDGCKTNNNVSNLEWVTQSENQIHAYKTGLQEITDEHIERLSKFAKAKRRAIRVVNKELGINCIYDSISSAAKEVPCNEKTLRNVLKERNKSRLGYEITYI